MTVGTISHPWGTAGYNSQTSKYVSDFPTGPWTPLGLAWSGIYEIKSWNGVDRAVQKTLHPYTHTYFVYKTTDKVKFHSNISTGRKSKAVRKQTFKTRRVKRQFRYGGTKPVLKNEWHNYSMSRTFQYYPRCYEVFYHPFQHQYYKEHSFITFYQEGSWLHLQAPPVWDANDEIQLIGKLRERVRGHDFNPSIFFAEGLEAVDMISHTASRLAASLISLRRNIARLPVSRVDALLSGQKSRSGDHLLSDPLKYLLGQKDAERVLKGIRPPKNATRIPLPDVPRERLVASKWLEIQFGWLPLLSDIKSGAEFLSLQALNKPAKQQWVVYRKKKIDKAILDSINSDFYFQSAECFTLRKIVFRATEDPNTTAAFSGILDPELVAWELLPYSFLLDYLLPVGDYLEARAFSQSLKGSFLTTTLSGISQFKPIMRAPYSGSFGPVAGSKFSMVRAVSSSLNVPLPKIKKASEVFSFTRLGNVFALLGVATNGRGLPRR